MKSNDLRVSHKLWSVVLGWLLALLLVAGWTLIGSRQVSDDRDQQLARYAQTLTSAAHWRGLEAMALDLNADSFTTSDAAMRQDFAARATGLNTRILPLQQEVQKAATTPQDKVALAAIVAARAGLRGQTDTVNALQEAGDAVATQAWVDAGYRPRGQAYLAAIDQWLALQTRQRDAARQTAAQAAERVLWRGLASGLLVLVLGALLSRWLVRSITQPLQRAAAVVDAIAAGDLTLHIQVPRKDEFGPLQRALAGLVAQLRGVVVQVRASGDAVLAVAEGLDNDHDHLGLSQQTAQSAAALSVLRDQAQRLADGVSVFNLGDRRAHKPAAAALRPVATTRPVATGLTPAAWAMFSNPAIKYPVKAADAMGWAQTPPHAKPPPALRRPVAITAKPMPAQRDGQDS